MVDRRLTNCPFCGEQNVTFIYRTNVGSGQTTHTYSRCGHSFVSWRCDNSKFT